MEKIFIHCLLEGDNNPPEGFITFDTSDHIRFQNGVDVSGHNANCNRRFKVEKNIKGHEGYTVTIFNLDGIHPLWKNNIQMAPKRMRITNVHGNIVELCGYGLDSLGATFADYGILLQIENNEILRIQLNMFDRNTSIVYLK